ESVAGVVSVIGPSFIAVSVRLARVVMAGPWAPGGRRRGRSSTIGDGTREKGRAPNQCMVRDPPPWVRAAAASTAAGLVLADLEALEGGDGGAGLVQDLLDGLLGVGDGRLLQQDDVLEEAVEAALDDLRQGGLGLALLAGDVLQHGALGLDA